jgi:hypothetical protein
MAGRLTLDQPVIRLGIGATAARHALDVEIGVRIPDPQHKKCSSLKKNWGILILKSTRVYRYGLFD